MKSAWSNLRRISLSRIGIFSHSALSSSREASILSGLPSYQGSFLARSKAMRLRSLWIALISARDIGSGNGKDSRMASPDLGLTRHDPEKWAPAFEKDHAQRISQCRPAGVAGAIPRLHN